MTSKSTFCRICEPLCPLRAEVNHLGDITRLSPDRDHPVSEGFACHKGLNYLEVHNHPERVNTPLKKAGSSFDAVGWETAVSEIGRKLRDIRERHGENAIGTYYGNPIAFSTEAFMSAVTLAARLGSRHCFGAATQDMSNKPIALEALFGKSQWTIPDTRNAKFLLCIGSNPKVSHWSLFSTPRPMDVLKQVRENGGKVCFVNPRRIESSNAKTGEVLQIQPDTDVYLLLALFNALDAQNAFKPDLIEKHSRGLKDLRAFAAPYTADVVSPVVGISAEQIHALADDIVNANGAAFYMGTGVNQGRQGVLAYWLMNVIAFLTGNIGREGGNIYGKNFLPIATSDAAGDANAYFETPLGYMRHAYGALPGNLLADFIESPEEPVRALIVLSGNPLLSIGGEERLRKAFDKLELLVCVDLFANDTGQMADYVLPAADWLERADINHIGSGVQAVPYLQYTDALVEPKYDRKPDAWILDELERELGVPPLAEGGAFGSLDHFLTAMQTSREALRSKPAQTETFSDGERSSTPNDFIAHPDGRADCFPEALAQGFQRCEAIFKELQTESSNTLKLISLRTNYMHNGNLARMPALQRGDKASNYLHMHGDDLQRLGLESGNRVRVSNEHGKLETAVIVDDSLRPGVVAMSHGYSEQREGCANVNRLLPTGLGSYDPLSNMSFMNGVAVDVVPADGVTA